MPARGLLRNTKVGDPRAAGACASRAAARSVLWSVQSKACDAKMPTGRHVASDVPFTEGFEVWFDRVAGRSQCHLHAASLGINPNTSSVLFDRDEKSFCGFLRDDRGRAARVAASGAGRSGRGGVCAATLLGLADGGGCAHRTQWRATSGDCCRSLLVSSVAMCARRRCVDDAYLAWAGFTGGLNVTNLLRRGSPSRSVSQVIGPRRR